MKNRKLVSIISNRLKEIKPLIQVLVGPRQVGKTTALKKVLVQGALYQSADYPTPLPTQVIEDWWDLALKSSKKILAIDEVQKIPGWSEVIKKRWDQKPHALKLVLTGSSALLMEKGLRETLAGRFELIRAEHWNYQEADRSFNLSLRKFIEFGCYPGSIPLLKTKVSRWAHYIRDSIIEPALGRDLLQLYPVDQPALLRQIFGVSVGLPAQIVSLQKLQGQLQGKGSLPTIQHYLTLLSSAYLVTGLEKYSPTPIRSRKSSPKLIVHDNAIIRAFERPVEKGLSNEKIGRYFENMVGARFIEAGWDLYYWKQRDMEVDFVVEGPNQEKWAIEVKSNSTHEKELKGLFKFCKIYPEFQPKLISMKDQKINGVESLETEKVLSLKREY